MKNFNVEPQENIPLEDVVSKLGSNRMLELTRQGYRLYRFEPSKENRTYIASTEHTLDVYSFPEAEMVQEYETSNLQELNFLLPDKEIFNEGDDVQSNVITSDNHTEWLGTIIKPTDIIDAALQEVQTRQYTEGEGEDDSANDQFMVITNEQSGQQKIIKVDLASLILNGSVEVTEEVSDKVFSNGDMLSKRTINFKFGEYLDALIESVGLDSQNCAIRSRSGTDIIDTTQMNIAGLTSIWRSDSYGERIIQLSS